MGSHVDKRRRMMVRVGESRRYWRLRVILAYEAGLRCQGIGQTMCELVLASADMESYPDEVRAAIAEIDDSVCEEAKERGIERALKQSARK